jgi:phosphoglycerate kinase
MIALKKKFTDSFNFVVNKIVIVRIDLNLPMFNGKITDFTRLEKIIPTLQELLNRNAKVCVLSHFGRPNGSYNKDLSLKPIVTELEKKLNKTVCFCDDNIKTFKKEKLKNLFNSYSIILLENIRFYPDEEKNEETFSKKLASFGDIFINECFSTSHRNHSSIVGIPKYLPSFPGKLLETEVHNLKNLLSDNNSNKSVAVFGGSKISTKIKIIEYYANKFTKILVGGAMANTFLQAMGIKIGSSIYEKSMIKIAREYIKNYDEKIMLPLDVIIISKKNEDLALVKGVNEILKDDIIMDIGPQTRMKFFDEIVTSDKLLWNGPLGLYEKKPFDAGTNFVMKAVKDNKSKNFFSIAGGGDTISLLKQGNNFDNFSFVSTGGGAFLEFIQGVGLPGLLSLNE